MEYCFRKEKYRHTNTQWKERKYNLLSQYSNRQQQTGPTICWLRCCRRHIAAAYSFRVLFSRCVVVVTQISVYTRSQNYSLLLLYRIESVLESYKYICVRVRMHRYTQMHPQTHTRPITFYAQVDGGSMITVCSLTEIVWAYGLHTSIYTDNHLSSVNSQDIYCRNVKRNKNENNNIFFT